MEDEETNIFNLITHTPYQSFLTRNSLRKSCQIPHCFFANHDNTECQICNNRETGIKLFDDFLDDNFEFYFAEQYIEDSLLSHYPYMFDLMLSFYKVRHQFGEENFYLTNDHQCVDMCELVEPRGKYVSKDENISVRDSYGNYVTGKVCSCGSGWSRLREDDLECFDCSSIDPFCASCELDEHDEPICTGCSSEYLMPTHDQLSCQFKIVGCTANIYDQPRNAQRPEIEMSVDVNGWYICDTCQPGYYW